MPGGDGMGGVVVRSMVPRSRQRDQFCRLTATLPGGEDASTTVRSGPLGVLSRSLDRGRAGLALPLIDGDVFTGVAASNSPAVVAFPAAHGSVGGLLVGGGR